MDATAMDSTAIVVTVVNLGLTLAFLVGVLALQVFLSRRKAWWPGLVLPACTLPGVLLDTAQCAAQRAGTGGKHGAGAVGGARFGAFAAADAGADGYLSVLPPPVQTEKAD